MIVTVLVVVLFILLRWFRNRAVISKKYQLNSDGVNQIKFDQTARTKMCLEKLEQRKKLEEEKANEKCIKEVGQKIAEKKKPINAMSKIKQSEPDEKNDLKGLRDPKKDKEHSDYIRDVRALIHKCKY